MEARKQTKKAAREQLKDWRKAQGHTQLSAASELGVTQNFIGNLERGERMPGLTLANTIRRLTGIKQEAWDEPAPAADPAA